MRKLTCSLCCLFLLVANLPTAAWAQDFVSFQLQAEIIEVHGENQQLLDDIKVGDDLNATLTYDPSISMMRVTAANVFMYDLGSNPASDLTFSTGEHSFNIPHHAEQGGITIGGFIVNLFSRVNNEGSVQICQNSISILAERFGEREDDMSAFVQSEITFNNFDCDYELDRTQLPRTIDMFDWDSAEILLTVSEVDLGSISIKARINSVENGVIEGVNVNGKVFADYNANCERDNADVELPRRFVRFKPSGYLAATNEDGEYSVNLPLGQYQAAVVEEALWSMACPAEAVELNLQSGDEAVTVDFALKADELIEAVDISVMSGNARPGFQLDYSIRIHNSGTLPYNGTIRFIHDQILTNFASLPTADSYINPLAEWEISDLPVGHTRVISISMKVPADETLLGTVICAQVESELQDKVQDQVLRESMDEICQEIRGSFDPNDIQVFVSKRNADGAITVDDQILTYLIRFQNEGNEDAITVRVVDELSQYHNIEKLRIGAASHDVVFNFSAENTLEWTFNNINLAPKERDEAASQGFVKFEVFLKDDLAVGTEIANNAEIYFDFNSPIVTNTVVSRITSTTTSIDEDPLAEVLTVYPNPSSDKLTLRFDETVAATIILRDVQGLDILSQKIRAAQHEIDLRTFAAGTYYLTVQTQLGVSTRAINIIR